MKDQPPENMKTDFAAAAFQRDNGTQLIIAQKISMRDAIREFKLPGGTVTESGSALTEHIKVRLIG